MRARLLAVAFALVTPRVSAQDRDAVRWLREGARLRADRRDAEALAAFERAWERCRCDEALGQRAVAEQALGRWGEAAERLDALEASSDGWVVRNRVALRRARAVIDRHVGAIDLRVDVPHAEVWVAGRLRGAIEEGARRLRADAGEVELRVEADGQTSRRTVRVEPGGTVRVEVELIARSAAPPTPVAVTVGAPLVVERPAARPRVLAPVRRSRTPWVWGVGGAAVLTLAGGAVALAVRNEAMIRYNDPACVTVFASREENCGALRRAAALDEALAVAGFVAGGVAALVAVVLAVTDRGSTSTHAWRCAPTGAPGLGCGAAF